MDFVKLPNLFVLLFIVFLCGRIKAKTGESVNCIENSKVHVSNIAW